jgi:VanZ family protein
MKILNRWLPAFFIMTVIFAISSRTGDELPNFANWDSLIKKGGHTIGYGLLALAYLHGLKWEKNRRWLAWLLAVVYSITDEFHQSFVSGRHASVLDVLLFDNLGALLAIGLTSSFRWKHSPGQLQ